MPVKDVFGDYPSNVETVPNLNPTQMALQNKVMGSAGNLLYQTNQYKFDFAPIEQQARENFQTKTVPSLAERFVGQGSGTHSSAFRGALGGAGSELETNLAALGAEYGLRNQAQQQGHLSNLLGYGLQQSQDNFYTPPQEGPGKQLVDAAGNIISNVGGAALSGHLAGKAAAAAAKGQAIKDIAPAVGLTGAAATTAVAGATPLLPILGGLAGAALLSYGIYRIVNRIKQKRQNAQEAKETQQQLAQFEQYRNANPKEFGPDFPQRAKGESLDAWAQRVNMYTQTKARSQGVDNLEKLIAEAAQ
jgi:hypothetical protein